MDARGQQRRDQSVVRLSVRHVGQDVVDHPRSDGPRLCLFDADAGGPDGAEVAAVGQFLLNRQLARHAAAPQQLRARGASLFPVLEAIWTAYNTNTLAQSQSCGPTLQCVNFHTRSATHGHESSPGSQPS